MAINYVLKISKCVQHLLKIPQHDIKDVLKRRLYEMCRLQNIINFLYITQQLSMSSVYFLAEVERLMNHQNSDERERASAYLQQQHFKNSTFSNRKFKKLIFLKRTDF